MHRIDRSYYVILHFQQRLLLSGAHGEAERKFLDPGPTETASTYERAVHVELFRLQAEKAEAFIDRLFR
jgi:hypothetical protein